MNVFVNRKPKIEQINFDAYDVPPDVAKKIEGLMQSIRTGTDTTPRSPLYKDVDADEVLARWLKVIDDSNVPQWMKDYERSRLKKSGPQGGLPSWEQTRENFYLYWERNSDVTLSSEVKHAIARRLQLYRSLNLTPATLEGLIESGLAEDKYDTNSGIPLWRKKREKMVRDQAVKAARSNNYKVPAVMNERFQKQKWRIFFMAGFAYVLKQGQLIQPLIKAIQTLIDRRDERWDHYASKRGFDFVEALLKQSILQSKGVPGQILYVQLDFDKMDTSCGLNQYNNLVNPMLGAAYPSIPEVEVSEINNYAVEMPVLCPDGLCSGPHGTASGVSGTNMDESIINDIYQYILIERLGKLLPHLILIKRQLDGDDGCLLYLCSQPATEADIETIKTEAANVAHLLGLEYNKDKMHVSTEYGLYLQRMLSINDEGMFLGAYPTIQALNTLMWPERSVNPKLWDTDYWVLRWIEVCENCKHHPLFHEFIDFVVAGDKTRLGTSNGEAQFRTLLSKWAVYTKLPAAKVMYTSLGIPEKRGNITDFETVKYLIQKYL